MHGLPQELLEPAPLLPPLPPTHRCRSAGAPTAGASACASANASAAAASVCL